MSQSVSEYYVNWGSYKIHMAVVTGGPNPQLDGHLYVPEKSVKIPHDVASAIGRWTQLTKGPFADFPPLEDYLTTTLGRVPHKAERSYLRLVK